VLNYRTTTHAAGCACCRISDAAPRVDPTGTASLRRAWRTQLHLRWQRLIPAARLMIVEQDLLTLGAKGIFAPANPAIQSGATKIQMFQRWFDWALNAIVLEGDGSFMRKHIEDAYNEGLAFGRIQVRQPVQPRYAQDRIEALFALAVVELQGVIEATSQQSVRAVANGILHRFKPARIMQGIQSRVAAIGISRSDAMVEMLTVKAFNEGVLDVYEALNVKKVGLIPEFKAAMLTDARRVKVVTRRATGPGSRTSRTETPSRSTISRIKRAEKQIERLNRVNVRTAGDDDVCKVCEAISEDGPYLIDTARSLIPAHPHCRCVFVPADDARFAVGDD
jgi:hypothetical protein